MPTLPTIPLPRTTHSAFRASRLGRGLALSCLLGALAAGAQAQVFQDKNDWKEDKAPPPPAFNPDKLIKVEMPFYSNLKFGIDPATVRITPDGVVSYVMVATNRDGGAFNAYFDGIHCATEEVKTYARFVNGAWDPVSEPEWKHMDLLRSSYAKVLFNQGMCREHAPWNSVKETLDKLRSSVREVE